MNTDELRALAGRLVSELSSCAICPRSCRVDRNAGELGICRTGRHAIVASFGPHFGEEAPLSGTRGSGTVFFSQCNLHCVFCQNYDISHFEEGREFDAESLAAVFLSLQETGCHNLNLVTPTHVIPQIVEALVLASEMGLTIPVAYNCGGYEKVETLRMLEGVVDIYMPDVKSLSGEAASRYYDAPDYPDVVRAAVKEMARQVGELVLDEKGLAQRGLLVRHLVMPGEASTTRKVIDFIAGEIGKDIDLHLMDQYRPCGKAFAFPEIARRPSLRELADAREHALRKGLTRIDGRIRSDDATK